MSQIGEIRVARRLRPGGHPFFANSVPLSRLKAMIGDLAPRSEW
jgi:hypothetical protein